MPDEEPQASAAPTDEPDARGALLAQEPERRAVLRKVAGVGAAIFGGGWLLGSLRAAGDHSSHTAPSSLNTNVRRTSLVAPVIVNTVVLIPAGAEGVVALDGRCTHLGCRVSIDRDGRHLVCPCHGSRFDLAGHPVHGPAQAPLRPLRTSISAAGVIWVHGLRPAT